VLNQDTDVLRTAQTGLHQPGFTHLALSSEEARLINTHRNLERYLGIFPSEMSGALFTPFVTTKSEGLGIGLTIAQGIVNAHGGTIAGSKNDEGGATFTITLPRSAALVTEN